MALVTPEDIRSEPQRLELLQRLQTLSSSHDEYLGLVSMLTIWPPMSTAELETKPSNTILVRMIENRLPFVEATRMLISSNNVTDSDVEFIRGKLEANEANWSQTDGHVKIAFLKLCLVSRNEKLVKNFLRFIELECFDNELDYDRLDQYEDIASLQLVLADKELMELLLQDQLYLVVVLTPLYALFVHYILSNESKSLIYEVVRALKKNEQLLEAAKLFAETENFCSSYKTVTSCLELIKKFDWIVSNY